MDPVGERRIRELLDRNALEVHVDDEGVSSGALPVLLLFLLLVELVKAQRRDVRSGRHAGNLRPQVVRLVA